MINLSSEQFNSIESSFWIVLGLIMLGCYFKLEKKFKHWALFSAVVLLTFGLSDFVQVSYGSFFQPHLLWLFIWKIVDVIGLIVSILWYLLIRLRSK